MPSNTVVKDLPGFPFKKTTSYFQEFNIALTADYAVRLGMQDVKRREREAFFSMFKRCLHSIGSKCLPSKSDNIVEKLQ